MKITFIGSGSAFTTDNYQSNMLIEKDEQLLLVDCGSDIRFSLNSVGLSLSDITDVYISHLHADHVGGLEGLGFCTLFNPNCPKPKLYINRQMAGQLWSSVLSGGMASIQCDVADLETYFSVKKIQPNGKFTWANVDFSIVQTIHVYDGLAIKPSYGLMFQGDHDRVFITTDTQYAPEQLKDFYNMADVIFHDCETSQFPSRVHAHYNHLVELPDDVRAKMWLYHYNPGQLPDAKADGFLGFIKKGDSFQL